MKTEPKYRLIILGAGFSKPAGLPIGKELLPLILIEAEKLGLSHFLERDLSSYVRLRSDIEGKAIGVAEVDLESFISYLDIEHFLLLRGSDTWSSEGNESQLLIRNLICKVLHESQARMSEESWTLYDTFASFLQPHDIVVTLNYDIILEMALSRKRIPFRFSWFRFDSVEYSEATVDSEASEVVLLKMHGSINWFDVSKYNSEAEYFQRGAFFQNPRHPVFSNHPDFFPEKIIGSTYPQDSPLNKVYYIKDVGKYIDRCQYVVNAPLIISPSYAKMVYLNPLKEFWEGFNGVGQFKPELIIVGFSFSRHDEYLLIPIVRAITNFQRYNQSRELDFPPANLKFVNFKTSSQEINEFKSQLPFIDWAKTDAIWNGLTMETVNSVFNTQPTVANNKITSL